MREHPGRRKGGTLEKEGVNTTETCSTCRGSGWLVKTEDSVEAVVPCPECRPKEGLQKLFRKAAIPPRYFDRGFEEFFFERNSLQERAQLRAIDYVEDFPNVPRGLLFSGPCGVGKTHLSVAILKTLIQEKYVHGQFVDEAELLRRLQYSYGPNSPETERAVLLPLSEIELLVWDDLGTGRPTEWVRETIRTVLNHRYTYNKQTILSTNWPLKPQTGKSPRPSGKAEPMQNTLAERIGQRLFSRIMEMCEIIEMDGPDFRTDIHKARHDFEKKTRRRQETGDRS
jgi:DNA replication protein DnaC